MEQNVQKGRLVVDESRKYVVANDFYRRRNDNACKHLLANKIILAWIMKSCLEEYRGSEISEIASKYIEGET